MIIVSGASGNVGTHVVVELASRGLSIRALSRSPDQLKSASANVEWVAADIYDPASLSRAMEGATSLVLISPAHQDMQRHQKALIDAAAAAGVKRISKLSGLGAGPNAPIRLPQEHFAIEQAIVESGIAHSLVRPNLFMQVLLGSADSIRADSVFYAPAVEAKISLIDARDVASVLVHEVLRQDGGNMIREITGPAALSYSDAAEILNKATGQQIAYVAVDAATARESMLGSGMDPWLVDAFIELFEVYRAGHGTAVLSGEVKAATGYEARTFAQFAADHKAQFLRAA